MPVHFHLGMIELFTLWRFAWSTLIFDVKGGTLYYGAVFANVTLPGYFDLGRHISPHLLTNTGAENFNCWIRFVVAIGDHFTAPNGNSYFSFF
jgi:hypothetical protein